MSQSVVFGYRTVSHFLLIMSYKFLPYTVSSMPGRLGSGKRDRTPGVDRGVSDKKPIVIGSDGKFPCTRKACNVVSR